MDIRQLETFVEVVECRNFSRAAENLFLTQPTISAHVNALEKEFNTQLIKRTTKDFEVTDAGERLYSFAIRMLSIKDKINETLLGSRGELLKIGCSSAISIGDLPGILSDFHKKLPDIKFEIINTDSLDIIKRVNDGLVEIGLVGTKTNDTDLQFIPFTTDELLFAMPNTEEYREILKSNNPFKNILTKPFIMREDASGTRAETLKFFNSNKVKESDINIVASLSEPFSIFTCIKSGLGVSVISSKIIKSLNVEKEVITHSLKEGTKRQFYIVCPKEKYMSELSKEFLAFLIKKYSLK